MEPDLTEEHLTQLPLREVPAREHYPDQFSFFLVLVCGLVLGFALGVTMADHAKDWRKPPTPAVETRHP